MRRKIERKLEIFFAFGAILSCAPACQAGDAAGDGKVGPPVTQNLSGAINHATFCKANLDELDKTYKRIKQAAWEIFAEVQTPDMIYVGGPEVVGTLVLPAINSSGYLASGEFKPPSKKWLDYFGMQLNYLVPAVTGEVAQLEPGDGASVETRESYARLVYLTNTLPAMTGDLLAVIHGPNYDNNTIAVRAQQMLDQLKSIEAERKALLKLCRKEGDLLKRQKKRAAVIDEKKAAN